MKIHSYRLILSTKHVKINIKRKRFMYAITVNTFTNIPLSMQKRKWLDINANILSFEYKCSCPLSYFGVIIGNELKSIRNIDATSEWRTVSIDLSEESDKIRQFLLRKYLSGVLLHISPFPTEKSTVVYLKNIIFRTRTKEENELYKNKLTYINRPQSNIIKSQTYLSVSNYTSIISKIVITTNHVHLIGNLAFIHGFPIFLCENRMYEDFSIDSFSFFQQIEVKTDQSFDIILPRNTNYNNQPYDRIYSRWVLAMKYNEKFIICSCPKYAEDLQIGYTFPPLKPCNKKGLGDFSYNKYVADLDELNISYITFNIRIYSV